MTKYCNQCGKPNDDKAIHCNQCGAKFDDKSHVKEEKNISKENKANFIENLPFLLAIISIIIGIVEGLSTPILFGYDNIFGAIIITIIGGLIGIYLMKKQENLIAGIEFIVVALILFSFIGNMAFIGTILFIVTGLITFYLKGTNYSSKKLFAIPIVTIILVLGILVIGGGISTINNQNSIEIGNFTEDLTYSYGYYEGNVEGDIRVDSDFDYLEVNMDFCDENGKVIRSTIAWNKLNVKGGETYHFSGMYFDEIQPTQVKVSVIDSSTASTPLYDKTLNITA